MNYVKAYRIQRGWSQTTLSLKTGGIAQSDISAIESGRKVPHPGWKKRIARAFGMKIDELFGENEKADVSN